jgi:hypothetical protein
VIYITGKGSYTKTQSIQLPFLGLFLIILGSENKVTPVLI